MESPDAIAAAAIATNAMWLEIQKSAKVSKMNFSQKEQAWVLWRNSLEKPSLHIFY